jgi:hypothetical protein
MSLEAAPPANVLQHVRGLLRVRDVMRRDATSVEQLHGSRDTADALPTA